MSAVEPILHRVKVRNYKSIGGCDVALRNLTLLVGPNGSGKSNFLDALSFVSDSLNTSLDHALRTRGGINDVRRRSHGRPNHFTIRLEFRLEGFIGHYAFTIGARKGGGFDVLEEECQLGDNEVLHRDFFRIKKGKLEKTSLTLPPAFSADRLYLVRLSGEPSFRPVFDALSRMVFYNLNPDVIREIQPVDEGQRLLGNGGNLASVFSQMKKTTRERVVDYLSAIVPGISVVSPKTLAGKETLEFKQITEEGKPAQPFLANCMSNGTLRALGILVALFQGNGGHIGRVPLVGIEEPEIALHPAASGVLFDVLQEAANDRQVIVTSHSPDLLDNEDIDGDDLLSVEARNGSTVIAPIDQAGRTALMDRLYTPGELLRQNQLAGDPGAIARQSDLQQMQLFDL